ncbi:hypothetical protein J4Q44_G00377610 [Coregonus suidteri]|uniref:Uncharacterized protein n=1 Tax=Coregonus suidteri TaxID=861788 RepID=A0AAN8KN78_9TELE
MEDEKSYDPGDRTLKFVKRQDDITLDDDPDTLRAEMSFGHKATPQSPTKWFKSLKQLIAPGPHSDQRLHLLQKCPTRRLTQATGTVGFRRKRWCLQSLTSGLRMENTSLYMLLLLSALFFCGHNQGCQYSEVGPGQIGPSQSQHSADTVLHQIHW